MFHRWLFEINLLLNHICLLGSAVKGYATADCVRQDRRCLPCLDTPKDRCSTQHMHSSLTCMRWPLKHIFSDKEILSGLYLLSDCALSDGLAVRDSYYIVSALVISIQYVLVDQRT